MDGESAVAAWREFEARTGLTPSQCKGAYQRGLADRATALEGARIYEVTRRLNVVDSARGGRIGRKVKWTPETVRQEWTAFVAETGRTPTQCMSKYQRRGLPRETIARANRVYHAASKLGVLDEARKGDDPA